MANLFVQKPPMIIAVGSATVRVNAPPYERGPLHIQIMKPPVNDDEGKLLEPGSFYSLWLYLEDAKSLADILYAQGALELVE